MDGDENRACALGATWSKERAAGSSHTSGTFASIVQLCEYNRVYFV